MEGSNRIDATNGTASDSVTVLRDSTPPVITLPASAIRTDAQSVTLTATSEAGAQVAIEGQAGGTRTIPAGHGQQHLHGDRDRSPGQPVRRDGYG